MTDATAEFFEELGRRGHEPLLERITGTLRFDIARGKRVDHWLVEVSKGDVRVSQTNSEADCVLGFDRKLFDRIAVGEENAFAAMLRGAVALEGDAGLLVVFQRLFPGPASTGDGRGVVGYAGRQA